jgi:DNA processing protein
MSVTAVAARLARAPGLMAEHALALGAEAQGDLERLCEPVVTRRVSLPPLARAALAHPDAAALRLDLEWISATGARPVLCLEEAYPPLLAATAGAPAVLYVLGSVEALKRPQLAMVGSRRPTPTGRDIAREFAAAFVKCGLAITSGLASGIDAASHAGALEGRGATVAVLGSGLDRIYPRANIPLAERVRSAGALVSEFPPRTPPMRMNFPRRNRVISALSLGTLVVEAAWRSGALITARLAAEQGREVFAIPGSIRNPLARGCHRLIRQGAMLVEEPGQVMAELGFHIENQILENTPAQSPPAARLDKPYEMLLDAFGFEPVTLDTLATRSGFSGDSIASMLLILELEGRIAPYPGGLYGRTR